MPELKNRQFLDFEKPIKDLYDQVEQLKATAEKTKTDMTPAITSLEQKIEDTKKAITDNLTPWQKVQLSRHPDRPYTLKYIEKMCTNFV
jgi:acetyl-CoA carboxylase carboxyl transferase subunit alpha